MENENIDELELSEEETLKKEMDERDVSEEAKDSSIDTDDNNQEVEEITKEDNSEEEVIDESDSESEDDTKSEDIDDILEFIDDDKEKETDKKDFELETDSDFEIIAPFENPIKKGVKEPIEIQVPEKKKIKINISPEFKKRFLKVAATICIIAVLVYALGIWYFSTHYFANTTIAGKDYSFKSYKSVIKDLETRGMEFDINLVGREETGLTVKSVDVDAKTIYDTAGLYKADSVRGLGWIQKCLDGINMDIPASVTIDEAKMAEIIEASDLCNENLIKKPENPYVKDCYSTTGQFEVVEGYLGTDLDATLAATAVNDTLKSVMTNESVINVDLHEADCYKHSVIRLDNAKLNAIKDKANKWMQAKITVDWNGEKVTLDGSEIRYMIDITENDAVLNEMDIRGYVLRQDDRYLTYGKTMTFTTHDKRQKNIKRRDYGWGIDVEAQIELYIDDIKNGRVVERELEYTHEAYVKGKNDIGNSYVEVDLGNQHMYVIINGKVAVESDFVSGNEALKHHTPDGIDAITYKAKNVVLRGPGYASPVSYWMPFNGGIGLHDATWRSSFGGQIYKTNGSHGCVNLPLSVAAEVYDLVEKDFPVVCYW